METAFFLMMGWCGTKYPGWRPWKVPPHPDPEPWWIYTVLGLGIIAGVVGGTVFSNLTIDNQYFAGQNAVASGLAAFAASGIVTGLASLARK
ncbi:MULTISPECIES: hypothetical protein [Flavobacterium]|jgi:hypothetical protein|uniref:GlsB/YeaQ/YmgE family stress response membrane protein n=1 Tax=Flavobacterium cupriresistens TaxID=2893885 RepID=A0ABU4R5P4_9FLAO|nr:MULTISPECIES: hypothetical protein [unclassified Flavobacterium]MDX6187909.1 hypothetical protein [Flavobacterium sp. Fl-318]UFH42171.1 hypothetical protein LNP23_20475 [Flavobacterium sp. F-323]